MPENVNSYIEGRQSEDEAQREANQVTEQLKQKFSEQEGKFTGEQYEKTVKDVEKEIAFSEIKSDLDVFLKIDNKRAPAKEDKKKQKKTIQALNKVASSIEKYIEEGVIDLESASRFYRKIATQYYKTYALSYNTAGIAECVEIMSYLEYILSKHNLQIKPTQNQIESVTKKLSYIGVPSLENYNHSTEAECTVNIKG
jgi:ribosomal protein S20